jgi:hypothetical protein
MAKNEHMVLKPIVYHGEGKLNNQIVQPGVVLDFSHLSDEDLQKLYDNMVLGPANKKEFDKHLADLRKAAEADIAAAEKAAQEEADAVEMLQLMKEQANLKEASK